ncbi:hypothetical protein [Promicromonospora sukumoe]|uniref:hypothetical protein n=1 Tax=Promicromonospora sukumoe TaxID=88382 RepID=UPI003646BC76
MTDRTATSPPSRYRVLATAFLTVLTLLALPLNATADSLTQAADDARAAATSSGAADTTAAQMGEADVAELEAQVALIQTHLSQDLQLDYGTAVVDGRINRATLKDFAIGIVAGGGSVTGAGNDAQAIDSGASDLVAHVGGDGAATLACEGRNGFASVPPTIYLSSCNASALSSAMAAGAAIATIAALIISWTGAGAAVAGVIAAALGLYSSIYALCNSWGHGIRIYVVTSFPVCWSQ